MNVKYELDLGSVASFVFFFFFFFPCGGVAVGNGCRGFNVQIVIFFLHPVKVHMNEV